MKIYQKKILNTKIKHIFKFKSQLFIKKLDLKTFVQI